MKELCFATWCV